MVLKFDSNICRVCSCEILGYTSIHLSESAEEFQYVTLLKFSENDGLPKSICPKCHIFLKIATIVKRTAISSEQKFKIIIQNAQKNFKQNIKLVNKLCIENDLEELTALLPLEDRKAIANINVISADSQHKSIDSNENKATKIKNKTLDPQNDMFDEIPTEQKDCKLLNSSPKYCAIESKRSVTILNDNVNRQIRLFKTEWIEHFQPWLIEKDNKAYCIFCGVHLSNIFSHIYRHKNTLKHGQNAKISINNTKMDQPLQKYKCSLCERCYMTKLKLLGHIKIHENGESNVKCAICSKSFRMVENLKDHLKSHVNHKASFKCLKCCKKFPRKATLLQHILTCDRSILINFRQCKQCPMRFTSFDDFYDHMNQDHDSISEDCIRCGLKFQTESSLRDHLLDHDIVQIN